MRNRRLEYAHGLEQIVKTLAKTLAVQDVLETLLDAEVTSLSLKQLRQLIEAAGLDGGGHDVPASSEAVAASLGDEPGSPRYGRSRSLSPDARTRGSRAAPHPPSSPPSTPPTAGTTAGRTPAERRIGL